MLGPFVGATFSKLSHSHFHSSHYSYSMFITWVWTWAEFAPPGRLLLIPVEETRVYLVFRTVWRRVRTFLAIVYERCKRLRSHRHKHDLEKQNIMKWAFQMHKNNIHSHFILCLINTKIHWEMFISADRQLVWFAFSSKSNAFIHSSYSTGLRDTCPYLSSGKEASLSFVHYVSQPSVWLGAAARLRTMQQQRVDNKHLCLSLF